MSNDKLMMPDIYVKVRFRTTAEGGRNTSLGCKEHSVVDFYACPLIVNGSTYDCRLLIGDQELELGKYYEVPVAFLNKDLALPNLSFGRAITLWEGKEVADGYISRIVERK